MTGQNAVGALSGLAAVVLGDVVDWLIRVAVVSPAYFRAKAVPVDQVTGQGRAGVDAEYGAGEPVAGRSPY
ncbi:MAG: hypothetical protein ABI120_15005 [Gemmatimonadaceae bacterium]